MTLLALLRHSNRFERMAALAALAIIAGLLLPWYRAPFDLNLSKSGLESFGFGQAALLLTAGASLLLISDRRFPCTRERSSASPGSGRR
jgi:hypothetical protein